MCESFWFHRTCAKESSEHAVAASRRKPHESLPRSGQFRENLAVARRLFRAGADVRKADSVGRCTTRARRARRSNCSCSSRLEPTSIARSPFFVACMSDAARQDTAFLEALLDVGASVLSAWERIHASACARDSPARARLLAVAVGARRVRDNVCRWSAALLCRALSGDVCVAA
jgi:hypothetical protein